MTRRKRKPKPPFYGAKLKCLDCHSVIQSTHRHHFIQCACYEDGGDGIVGIGIDGGGEYCRMLVGQKAKWEVIDPGNYQTTT